MLIGLTGGIGSGKSTVAGLLRDRGFTIIDADAIARDIVEPGQPALIELCDAFGPEIMDGERLDRKKLAQLAFASPSATEKLNSIMHPRIRQETDRRIKEAPGDVVYDMPLLVDLGLHKDMDLVVVVSADTETRVKRLIERGIVETDARKRMAAQISDEQREAVADVIIDNNGGLEDLTSQVDALVERIRNA
ncbi:dephospho-CoA kinase [Corynebacterium sp. H130]|uniref:dephospho-CoA kinase n=1 Tax=Corynebacterium sp. H130 TaxID=3133444 RepID=UPI0030B3A03B